MWEKILISVVDKLVIGIIIAGLGYWFNTQLNIQNIRGDYQKKIYTERLDGYVQIIKDLKSIQIDINTWYTGSPYYKNIVKEEAERINMKRSGTASSTWIQIEEILPSLRKIQETKDKYELFFPSEVNNKINDYVSSVVKTIRKEKQESGDFIKLENENKIFIELFRRRLKIEGVELGYTPNNSLKYVLRTGCEKSSRPLA